MDRVRNIFSIPDEGIFGGRTNDNIELLKAWAGTTLAFAILQSGGLQNIVRPQFITNLLISAIVCGLAFILHELAHRVVARHYGAEAHFIANNGWLLISIVIACLGFFIAAPGAVWHRGYLTSRQSGLIALAGPATNLILSVIFLIGLVILQIGFERGGIFPPGWVLALCYVGFKLNAWIGLFNMIPSGPFDGAKVLHWSPVVFGVTVVIGVVLAFFIDQVFSLLLRFF